MGRYERFNVLVPKHDKLKVQEKSHYNEKIDRTPGRSAGFTRNWGDASVPVQDAVIDAFIEACKAHHLSKHDAAVILAIARNESGFNPDAANKGGSASGTGQFMDETGPKYGVTPETRFDIVHNAEGIVQDYIDCKKDVEKRHHNAIGTEKDRWIYKYYHDWHQKGRGFKEFDKPDGVRQWISPIEGAIGPSFDSRGQAPTSSGPRQPPAGKNPPGPYKAPPSGGPVKPNAYVYPAERPNPLGPIPPSWDTRALPTGPNRLAGDSPLDLPSARANLPFHYSPSGARGPLQPEQPAPAPTGYPTGPLPSDSPFSPRRNPLSEPAQSVTPPAQPQTGGKSSPVQPPINRLGPWPGAYPEGSPDLLQTGSRNVFGPWPGTYPEDWKNLSHSDLERLLGLPPGAYAPSGQTWRPG